MSSKDFSRRDFLNFVGKGSIAGAVLSSGLLASPTQANADGTSKYQAVPQPVIHDRSCWGARAARTGMNARSTSLSNSNFLIFHHSGSVTFTATDHDTCAARIRQIQNLHMDTNKWSDIGYPLYN